MSDQPLLVGALHEVAGPCLVLNDQLKIVAFTPSATEILGPILKAGISAPKVLCGHGPERPVAEALAKGRAVDAEVLRPDQEGHNRAVRIRASPFVLSGERGWVLLIGDAQTREDDTADEFGIVTRNHKMRALLRDTRKVAASQATVLVRGETGSGKELIARAIHAQSPRHGGPFRALNCAALPPNLLASELFGHVRGAFTGAVRDHPGHFRLADGGTLFLDEVAELPPEMQASLLRVVQEGSVIPLGGRDPVSVDVRLISATHRSLRQEVEEGRFRADLLYRLRVIPLYLPPLRDRPEDIDPLVWHFLGRFRGERQVATIHAEAMRRLQEYDWPGNVRELANAVQYATVMGEGPVFAESDLPPEIRGEDGETSSSASLDPHYQTLAQDLPPEGRRLLNALERAGGHMGRAAGSLGISRTTLWRRLKRYGLDRSVIEG